MTLRVGLLVPHFGESADRDVLVEGARAAERYGFDSLWVRDHLVFHPHGMEGENRQFIEPFVTMSFLAGATDSIGLGAGTIIPHRHPIHMAQSVASLIWISDRRFDLGIGAGNFQHEFDAIGLGDADRPALMREQVEIARRLWVDDVAEYSSERYRFDDVGVEPRPTRLVPVWWGGNTPASARLAVDFCDGWLPGRINFLTYEARVAAIRERSAEQGRATIKVGAIPIVSIADTHENAVAAMSVPGLIKNANAQRFWIRPAGREFETIDDLEGSLIAGTTADVIEAIERYQAIGCDLLILDFRFRFADWVDQVDRVGTDVLPGLKATGLTTVASTP